MADPTSGRPDPDTDAGLWAATLLGDLSAFDALDDRHADAVHRLLVRRVGQHAGLVAGVVDLPDDFRQRR